MSKVQVQIVRDDTHAVVTVTNTESASDDHLTQQPQIDLSFCQDVSGSMGGGCEVQTGGYVSRLDLCKHTLQFILRYLKGHRVGLTSFDLDTYQVIPFQTVGEDLSGLTQKISTMRPGSSTNLSAGLQQSLLNLASATEGVDQEAGRVRYLMVFTDGQANAGLTKEAKLLTLLQQHLAKIEGSVRVALFAFGEGCNHDLLQRLATGVDGVYYALTSAEDIPSAIGEVFGTALETRQQNLELLVAPEVMETMPGEKATFPDLLRGESRSRLFRLMDPGNFGTGHLTLRYLDCETAETVTLPVSLATATSDPILVSESTNVFRVAEATRKAADLWGEARREILQQCLDQVLASASAATDKTQLLVATLREQLERGDLCPPSLLRQCSSNTRNFRGLGYASLGVANFAAESQQAVSSSISQISGETPALARASSAPVGSLGMGMGMGRSQRNLVPRPTLTRASAREQRLNHLA